MKTYTCAHCRREFECQHKHRTGLQTYCSHKCHKEHRTGVKLSADIVRHMSDGQLKMWAERKKRHEARNHRDVPEETRLALLREWFLDMRLKERLSDKV